MYELAQGKKSLPILQLLTTVIVSSSSYQILGREIDNYLLRVEVDVARRYWTIYRYDEVTFEDQAPDKAATERCAAERLRKYEKEPVVDHFKTPFLFRKAVIIVSWSRYMAVSAFYGPPSAHMLKEWEDEQLSSEQTAENGSNNQSELIKRSTSFDESQASGEETKDVDSSDFKCKPLEGVPLEKQVSDVTSDGGLQDVDESTELEAEPPVQRFTDSVTLSDDDDGDESLVEEPIGDESGDQQKNEEQQSSPEKLAAGTSFDSTGAPIEATSTSSSRLLSKPRRKKFREWARQQSKHISERTRSALERSGLVTKKAKRDPMEGVLHLKRPLLLCQEIYNRIIGNHQTSLITKEQALLLLQQDIAQHEKEHPETAKEDEEEDALMTGQEVILRTKSEDSGDGAPEQKTAESDDDEEIDVKALAENFLSEDPNADLEKKEEEAADGENGEEKEQPLVGYWLWENTLRTHKMTMHVGKGADLALHVILAIVTNQVRYERNALAMTV